MNRRYIVLLILLLCAQVVCAQGIKRTIDSLLQVLPAAKDDTNKVHLLYEIAYNCQGVNPTDGVKYANMALILADKLGWERGRAIAYGVRGINYKFLSNYPDALADYFRALKINEAQGYKNAIAANMGNIGTVYNEQGDYARALEYYRKSLGLDMELGDRHGISTTLGNISTVFAMQYNFDSALVYYIKALKLNEEDGDKSGMIGNLANIATMLNDQKKYEDALGYYNRALAIAKELDDKNMLAVLYGNMGMSYAGAAKDNKSGTGMLNGGKNANAEEAVKLLTAAINLCRQIKYPEALQEFEKALSEVYELQGNNAAALKHYKEYTIIKDSVFSTDNKVAMANLATRREEELKEKQIEINKLSDKEQDNERAFFIVGLGLLLITIVFVSRSYTGQRRANNMLKVEKEKSDGLATELAGLLEQKEGLMDQLARQAAVKSKFFANMSHELRTPITLLTGMLELMKNGKTGKEQEKMAVAYGNSMKLKNMVEELLDISKLEQIDTGIKTEIRPVAPMLKRMVYAFESLIYKEGLELKYESDIADNIYIAVDESRFEKIINNLVYNAIKFNQTGGWIRAGVAVSQGGKEIVITIANSGRGIAEKDIAHVFERYYQASDSKTIAAGAGIGLALVKEFTLLLGGSVAVSSDVVAGTVFTLRFPVVEAASDRAEKEEELPMPEEDWAGLGRKQLVLIVEDNAEMRYYLKEVLGGYVTIAEAENGRVALEWLQQNKPDLVISDVMMPEMDGREFVNIVKHTDAYRKIPIITLTALADARHQLGMLRMGVDDYIVKPFNAVELRIRAYNLLRNYAERIAYEQLPEEAGDVIEENTDTADFKHKITAFVIARMKNAELSVYDLAYELAMSERQLYRLAKNLTGCTPAQLIKEVRLQQAYELLASGNIAKVDDVARRVGFENTGYFARQFLDRFGKRATDFL